MRRRRICFVTGTRAEFGLMRSALSAIRSHPRLQLQIVVTGMHLDRTRGSSSRRIATEGWGIDRIVRWPTTSSPCANAARTGLAMSRLAETFEDLQSDVVLVVGDRVEAFAAAAAGHLCGCAVAHVHGGDRALGQVDDALRHAITKLAHIHFPATEESAARIARLGEQRWRIHRVGSPGLDDLNRSIDSAYRLRFPPLKRRDYAVVLLHPIEPNERLEFARAGMILRAVESLRLGRIVIIYPNTDPGAAGIVRCWRQQAGRERVLTVPDLPRGEFFGLLRGAAVLVGNSSSGIIEAASLGTRVLDIGPRQSGRQRSENVTNVPYSEAAIRSALRRIVRLGPFRGRNVYGHGGAGAKIARILGSIRLDGRLRRKLIAY